MEILEAEFAIAAALALNFGVAAGEVHIIIGIYFKVEVIDGSEIAELTAFMRFGGSLNVLGLISVSIELYLGMRYELSTNALFGQATLTIEIDLLFFGPTIEVDVERQLAGPSTNGMGSGLLGVAQAGGAVGRYADIIGRDAWLEHAAAFVGAAAGPLPPSQPESPPPPTGDTLAVPLDPGWNLVGWNGDPAAVESALASVTGAFSDAFTYDPAEDVFLRYSPAAPSFVNSLSSLPPSAGVWVLATRSAVWQQPIAASVESVALLAGFNLVAWRGPAAPAAAAFAAIATALISAFTYDAAGERFRSYAPGRLDLLNDLAMLQPGDGVWLNMVTAAPWRPTV